MAENVPSGPGRAPAMAALAHGTRRTVFALLTVFGIAMVVAVVRGIPQSLPVSTRQGHGLAHSLARMADLLRDKDFTRHVVVQCLATAGSSPTSAARPSCCRPPTA